MQEQEITLSEILIAREERAAIQTALLGKYKAPVISFTMNMAGPVKVTALSHRAFLWGCQQLRLGFVQNKFSVLTERTRILLTGDEAYFSIDAPAEKVKALCVEIEESSPAGRFYDMDVIGLDGRKLERGMERPCIVCGKPGRDCASRRLHTVEELQWATKTNLHLAFFLLDQRKLSRLATHALLEEVAVTPKPGLVDRANNGAHQDMDFSSFQASAAALTPYWEACFQACHSEQSEASVPPSPGEGCIPWRIGVRRYPDGPACHSEQSGASVPPAATPERETDPSTPLRSAQDDRQWRLSPAETFSYLRPLGKQAERDMLAATGGVNTHKGAIFTLGVLCGAIGRLWTAEEGFPSVDIILDEAAAMTRQTLEAELPAADWHTAGESLYKRYGIRGIRGEVADGLPAVQEIALPVFKKLLAGGLDRNHAAAVTLLHLITNVEDTNLLHRGGQEGAAWAKHAASDLIVNGSVPSLDEIAELDRQFIERNLSPGGCADLLAVTFFLERLDDSKR